jgi:hypothetical protein
MFVSFCQARRLAGGCSSTQRFRHLAEAELAEPDNKATLHYLDLEDKMLHANLVVP